MTTNSNDQRLPRQLVICCDGTNNNLTGGKRDTNVVKFVQLLAQSTPDASRIVFYDPGVGNAGELPGVTFVDSIKQFSERLASLAFGRGIFENMAQCYLFLMQNFQIGDEIFIFGFSRGAFTARSFAGLINQFGILAPQMQSMLPTLLHLYFSDRNKHGDQMQDIAQQTTQLFAAEQASYVEIQFVGVWDTVASVGLWPFNLKITAKPTIHNKRFVNVRHAMALDEHRAQFLPRLYTDNNASVNAGGVSPYKTAHGTPATIQQLWFRGAHGDVGGGFNQGETAISDQALCWMVSEAVQCGLRMANANGSLATEAAVHDALQNLYASKAGKPVPTPRTVIHSQLREKSMWALTGMQVRSTTAVALDNGQTFAMHPVEHPSVAVPQAFPANTAWAKPHDRLAFWLAFLLSVVFLFLLGHFLTNPSNTDFSSVFSLPAFAAYLLQDANFASWQLLWWRDSSLQTGIFHYAAPLTALLFDCAFIVTYAYVLSWLVVRAFAQIARLRRAGDTAQSLRSRVLNKLGWALPLAVFSDIAENLFTWWVIESISANWSWQSYVFAVFMTLFALAKFVGLLGVLLLLLWSLKQRWTLK